MNRRRTLLAALALSFTAYLIPLFNVHAGLVPMGIALPGNAGPSFFFAATLASALALQAVLFALAYWVLSARRWWKWLLLIASAPLVIYGANLVMLYLVPLAVLVERDPRAETGELALSCTVSNATLAQVQSGAELALERAGEAWVIRQDNRTRARLTMPGCRLAEVAAPRTGSSMDHVAAGGYLLFRRDSGGLAYAAPHLGTPVEIAAPVPGKYWDPTLSDDGRMLAWLDRETVDRGPRPHRLRLLRLPVDGESAAGEPTAGEPPVVLGLAPEQGYEMIGAGSGRYTLARYRNEIIAVDLQGRIVAGPISPPGIYDARWGFRWLPGGWVAWDGYRESGRCRVAWSLPTGAGEFVVPKGRGIRSLAVSPDGGHIALSVSTSLSIGSIQSAVVVLRTADGGEVYRRYHPHHTRTRLAYLGTEYLAMTRFEDGESLIRVYRAP